MECVSMICPEGDCRMYVRTPWRTPGCPFDRVALCLSPSMPITIRVARHTDCVKRQLTFTTSLNTDQPNLLIGDKVIERSNGVAAATNTGHNDIWQFPSHFQ